MQQLGRYSGSEQWRRALDVATELKATAEALNNLGVLAGRQGDRTRTISFLEQAAATYRELGARMDLAWTLQEVGNALATETDLEKLLDLVVRRLRELVGARVVALALPSGTNDLRFAAVAGAGDLLGTTIAFVMRVRVDCKKAIESDTSRPAGSNRRRIRTTAKQLRVPTRKGKAVPSRKRF